jgi:hypothetical protein
LAEGGFMDEAAEWFRKAYGFLIYSLDWRTSAIERSEYTLAGSVRYFRS